jgi:hypothetical protein
MKLVSFHLMPYRPLDLAEAAKHRSPWVVLPNPLYDPVKGAEEYARHIDALVYAEELGFDAIGVNEHHQTAYGLMPAPNLIASALIQRTKTIKIAILGRALPLVNNPIYIAEEFAMLDVLSKGSSPALCAASARNTIPRAPTPISRTSAFMRRTI